MQGKFIQTPPEKQYWVDDQGEEHWEDLTKCPKCKTEVKELVAMSPDGEWTHYAYKCGYEVECPNCGVEITAHGADSGERDELTLSYTQPTN